MDSWGGGGGERGGKHHTESKTDIYRERSSREQIESLSIIDTDGCTSNANNNLLSGKSSLKGQYTQKYKCIIYSPSLQTRMTSTLSIIESYRFVTTWRWLNYDRMYIFGWTVPLKKTQFSRLPSLQHIVSAVTMIFILYLQHMRYQRCAISECAVLTDRRANAP